MKKVTEINLKVGDAIRKGLQRKGMKNVIKYGMAFWEKECMVLRA